MYEELYAPLPSVEAYLAKLKVDKPQNINVETLNQLIYAHQCTIPFENLDVFEDHKEITLAIEPLFEKIIRQPRGGYCFELNALFQSFLNACGFNAYSCRCRILRGKDYTPPSLHRGILVNLEDQLWFADVGYGGPMPGGALLVADGFRATYCNQTFTVNRADEYWWTLSYISKGTPEQIIQFTTMPQEPVEFLAPNEYCSKNENSVFLNKRFVNLRTPSGSLAITDNTFTAIKNGTRTETTIQSPTQMTEILQQQFGITRKS